VLTRAHLAIVIIQSALRAKGPRFKAGIDRIVSANRIIIVPTISRAIFLILLCFLSCFDSVLYIFRRSSRIFDIFRLLYVLHGGVDVRLIGMSIRFLAEREHAEEREG